MLFSFLYLATALDLVSFAVLFLHNKIDKVSFYCLSFNRARFNTEQINHRIEMFIVNFRT